MEKSATSIVEAHETNILIACCVNSNSNAQTPLKNKTLALFNNVFLKKF